MESDTAVIALMVYLLIWAVGIGIGEAVMRTEKWRDKNL
jgi:hypothetical protein